MKVKKIEKLEKSLRISVYLLIVYGVLSIILANINLHHKRNYEKSTLKNEHKEIYDSTLILKKKIQEIESIINTKKENIKAAAVSYIKIGRLPIPLGYGQYRKKVRNNNEIEDLKEQLLVAKIEYRDQITKIPDHLMTKKFNRRELFWGISMLSSICILIIISILKWKLKRYKRKINIINWKKHQTSF